MPRCCIAWLAASLTACGGADSSGAGATTDPDRPGDCPATAPAPSPLPGVRAEHRSLEYWLQQQSRYGDIDEVLLTPAEVADHNHAFQPDPDGNSSSGYAAEAHVGSSAARVRAEGAGSITNLNAPVDRARVEREVRERLEAMRERITSGQYLNSEGQPLSDQEVEAFALPNPTPPLRPALHRANEAIRLRCGPREAGLFTESLDPDFDRNNCSMVRSGEPIQTLATWRGMRLARTPYALGWIRSDAPLGPLDRYEPPPQKSLTRRAVLEAAFGMLDEPYGWGGHQGGRDCSRFLMDVFSSVGLLLPRHSGRQALAGTFSVDVSSVESDRDRIQLLESTARRGLVLIHFPGHIALYLGQDAAGVPMAIHSFSEYLEPCSAAALENGDPAEILRRVDRVTVSDLELGRGTSRRSFLERITRLTVLGEAPGVELHGAAVNRRPAPIDRPSDTDCRDSLDASLFRSPATPNRRTPLRIIATLSDDPGPVALVLFKPNGERVEPTPRRLGGPPYSLWTEIEHPAAGRWTAVVGDGSRILACERFSVRGGPAAAEASETAWTPRWRWERDVENLYAAFVEQLLDYPIEEDLTWTNLQSLLTDRSRNLLHGHLGQGEDEALRLQPDCADLPYFLRAYFAWKTRLPFGFRRCSRGRAGRPPSCGEVETNLAPRVGSTEVEAFSAFIRSVRDGVHSASARTAPNDSQTDLYPIPLNREALRPGTVFADPYGHLLVIADWIPQGATDYGILVGVDAQPDGTIGRRRFWRGSFLFDPSTEDVGAGFKGWRPVVFDRTEETMTTLDNRALASSRDHVPFSRDQYEGSKDAFYERLEALINPRPLDPTAVQGTLIDALEEAVTRRVVSVNNGIEYMAEHRWRTVEMPTGYSVFETSGPWEDFATPARDLRLLISIDAVRGFPDRVRQNPERFGLASAQAATVVEALETGLGEELATRRFSYRRTDGTEQTLTLQNVIERAEDFEMAYNPNDCVEVRWAAPEGSDELAGCAHRAPASQQQRMRSYRNWFQNRRRPPR